MQPEGFDLAAALSRCEEACVAGEIDLAARIWDRDLAPAPIGEADCPAPIRRRLREIATILGRDPEPTPAAPRR